MSKAWHIQCHVNTLHVSIHGAKIYKFFVLFVIAEDVIIVSRPKQVSQAANELEEQAEARDEPEVEPQDSTTTDSPRQ